MKIAFCVKSLSAQSAEIQFFRIVSLAKIDMYWTILKGSVFSDVQLIAGFAVEQLVLLVKMDTDYQTTYVLNATMFLIVNNVQVILQFVLSAHQPFIDLVLNVYLVLTIVKHVQVQLNVPLIGRTLDNFNWQQMEWFTQLFATQVV